MSEDTPQDGPFFWAAAIQHLRSYHFSHINKRHTRSKFYATFFYEGGKPFTNGALAERDYVGCDKEGILIKLGKVRANSADINVHEFILVWQHWADRLSILSALVLCH